MTRLINAVWAVLFLSPLMSFPADADEGFWTYVEVAGGGYYSEVNHPDISLENEVLIYRGSRAVYGQCEAYFLFRNTSPHPVSVRVGFPVSTMIPQVETYEFDPAHWLMKNFSVFGSTREVMSYERFTESNKIGGRAVIVPSLTITQDGREVEIDSVLVETSTANPDTAVMAFHFLHLLDFQPGAHSTVRVGYESFSSSMNTGNPDTYDYINWHYILGTGNTWKGPIGTVFSSCPIT